jgi:hypothetical protein
MQLTFVAHDLVLASWLVPAALPARDLPAGVEPALTEDGRAVVSLVAFRAEAVRLDGRRVPSFAQLNVRTYVRRAEETGIFLLSLRVTPPGLGGIAFGVPVRPARIRVREGTVQAPGLGYSLRYRRVPGSPEVPVVDEEPIGSQAGAFLVSAGLRRIVAEHDPFAWEPVELTAPARFDPVLALGLDVGPPDSLLYAGRTGFRAELPLPNVR